MVLTSPARILDEKTDEELIEAIKNGKDDMPAFPDLSDREIGEVLAYIKSLTGLKPEVTKTPVIPKKTGTPEKIVTKKSPGMSAFLTVAGLSLSIAILRRRF